MSRDVFVQEIPPNATTVADIPDSFQPGSIATRSQVLAAIRAEAPSADLSDLSWVRIEQPELYYIEINLGTHDVLDSFAFHVSGGIEADRLITRILERLALRAFDPASPTGLFQPQEELGA